MDVQETVIVNPAVNAVPRPWKLWVPVGLAVVAAGALGVRWARGGAKAAPPQRAVPVTSALVRAGDMPVNLTGLGTVVPTDAVTLRTRVDGQIMKINFREGQMVRQGELLVQIDPRPFQVQLMQAEGQLAKDQAALRNARNDLERIRALFAQKIVSQQQLDAQTTQVDQFEAAVKSDQASVESARLNLTYSRITAPVAGKAGLRLVDTGNMVKASDTTGLVTLTPVSPINVLFTVPADSIGVVLESQKGGRMPAVEVYDRDLSRKLGTGTLLAVDNQVDPATGTVKLKAQFANKDGALFPNQFVNARLLVDTLKGALMVPTGAVQQSTQGAYVYVVRPDMKVDYRKVQVRLTDGETTALSQGVADGERVVLSGLDKLRQDSSVTDPALAPKPPQHDGAAKKGGK